METELSWWLYHVWTCLNYKHIYLATKDDNPSKTAKTVNVFFWDLYSLWPWASSAKHGPQPCICILDITRRSRNNENNHYLLEVILMMIALNINFIDLLCREVSRDLLKWKLQRWYCFILLDSFLLKSEMRRRKCKSWLIKEF